MELLTPDLFLKLRLTQCKAALVACASKAMYALVHRAWCINGIMVHESQAANILERQSWTSLERLYIYGAMVPLDCLYSWKEFGYVMPRLKELRMNGALHPLMPWNQVLQKLPALTMLDIKSRLGRKGRALECLRDAAVAAAPRVKTLRIRSEGLIVYPLPFGSFELCDIVRKMWEMPPIDSDTLQEFVNIGRQMSTLPIDAPLRTLRLEDGEYGPVGLSRIGPKCNETLKTLSLRFYHNQKRFPRGIRCRFPNVEVFSVQIDTIRYETFSLSEWIENEVPLKTKKLTLDLDLYLFLPEARASWSTEIFAALEELQVLVIRCSHAVLGTSELVRGLKKASHKLRKACFETHWCPVRASFGDLSFFSDDELDEESEEDISALQQETLLVHRAGVEIKRERPHLDLVISLCTTKD